LSETRPFRIIGVQQIALGAADKERLAHLWVELFGLERTASHRIASENVEEDTLIAGLGPLAVEIDLMQPIDPRARPHIAEPALHHVGLWVDDLARAVEWLTAHGVRFAPGGIRRGAAGHDVCFIHPRGSAAAPQGGEGVLIELVQAPPEVVAAHRALSNAP
jgi:lactoylglutathione lyase